MRHLQTLILPMIILACCAGCAAVVATTPRQEAPVWPSPQHPGSRIEWISEIRGPKDHGIEPDYWAKIMAFFVGASDVRFIKPYGVYADGNGLIAVADTEGGIVHLLDGAGKEYRTIPDDKTKAFASPVGVTGDGARTLFITDSAAGTVYRYDTSSRNLERLTPFSLQRPAGIAYAPAEKLLYVSDTLAHHVVAIDAEGKEAFRIGGRGTGKGMFNFPTDLFIRQGLLYVTDSMNFRIQVFTCTGDFVRAFGMVGDVSGTFAKPKGVAADSDGNIYIADALFDAVQVFSVEGSLLIEFGKAGTGAGEFSMPAGLFIDGADNIYVSDPYNHRIQVFRCRK